MKENIHINKASNNTFTKKVEVIEEELTEEHLLNEYIGSIKQKQYLLKELNKVTKRIETLKEIFDSICNEYYEKEKAELNEVNHSDKIDVLEKIKVHMNIYTQIKNKVKST